MYDRLIALGSDVTKPCEKTLKGLARMMFVIYGCDEMEGIDYQRKKDDITFFDDTDRRLGISEKDAMYGKMYKALRDFGRILLGARLIINDSYYEDEDEEEDNTELIKQIKRMYEELRNEGLEIKAPDEKNLKTIAMIISMRPWKCPDLNFCTPEDVLREVYNEAVAETVDLLKSCIRDLWLGNPDEGTSIPEEGEKGSVKKVVVAENTVAVDPTIMDYWGSAEDIDNVEGYKRSLDCLYNRLIGFGATLKKPDERNMIAIASIMKNFVEPDARYFRMDREDKIAKAEGDEIKTELYRKIGIADDCAKMNGMYSKVRDYGELLLGESWDEVYKVEEIEEEEEEEETIENETEKKHRDDEKEEERSCEIENEPEVNVRERLEKVYNEVREEVKTMENLDERTMDIVVRMVEEVVGNGYMTGGFMGAPSFETVVNEVMSQLKIILLKGYNKSLSLLGEK